MQGLFDGILMVLMACLRIILLLNGIYPLKLHLELLKN